MKNNNYLVLFAVLILFLPACAGPVTETEQNQVPPTATLIAGSLSESQSTSQSDQRVSFSKDILPIFQQYSDSHHSTDRVLLLETYNGVMKGVVPRQPEQSKLYLRLIGKGGPVMPPGNPLPEKMIILIYNWIKQGAKNN